MRILILVTLSALLSTPDSMAQRKTHYDESQVPDYELPDPLVTQNGQRVVSAEMWKNLRRPEILKLFETHVYGRTPSRGTNTLRAKQFSETREALNGTAIRREVTLYFTDKSDGPSMDLLIYSPLNADGPVPTFVGLNFEGNHAVDPDPTIKRQPISVEQ